MEFEDLWEKHKLTSFILNYLYREGCSEFDSLDLMQTIALKAYESFDQLKDLESFKFWVLTITRRVLWRFRNKTQVICEEGLRNLAYPGGSPEEKLETELLIEGFVKTLKEKTRRCFICYFVNNLNLRETSLVLDYPVSTVSYHIGLARKSFKKYIQEINDKTKERCHNIE